MNEEMQAQATLFAKLARVMGKVRSLPKTGHNTHFNYKFVTDGAVSDAISAALAAENVAFIPSVLESRTDGKITRTRFLMTFACGDTGAVFQSMWEGEGMDNQDKGVSKSATSAVKYFLLKTFLIDTGERADDPDNDAALDGKRGGAKSSKKDDRQTSATDTPVTFNATTGAEFTDWAQAQFADLTGDDLIRALRRVAPDLTTIQQWPMSNQEAIAAIFAYQSDYDATTIRQWFKNLKGVPALKNRKGEFFTSAQLDTFQSLALKLVKEG